MSQRGNGQNFRIGYMKVVDAPESLSYVLLNEDVSEVKYGKGAVTQAQTGKRANNTTTTTTTTTTITTTTTTIKTTTNPINNGKTAPKSRAHVKHAQSSDSRSPAYYYRMINGEMTMQDYYDDYLRDVYYGENPNGPYADLLKDIFKHDKYFG